MGPRTLLVWMLSALAVVASLAFWDSTRESAAALDDFADEQSTLAAAAGAALDAKLQRIRKDGLAIARELVLTHLTSNGDVNGLRVRVHFKSEPPDALPRGAIALALPFDEQRRIDLVVAIDDLVGGLRAIERPGRILLLQRPGFVELVASDARNVSAEPLAAGLERGARSLVLSRPEALSLGLAERTAMAGLSTFEAGPFGKWGVAVVSTLQRERDRERRTKWRLVASVVLAAGLVFAFGGVALRKQRKELELSREIAVAEAQHAGDERLVRADKLATMGALATGIAHEVSTPLGVIAGRAEQLAPRVKDDERAARAVEAITAQAERITQIIRAFLSLARGDAPALVRADPADIARACTELVEHRFTKAGVTITARVDPSMPKIACDLRLFEQAINNLLLNACDACAEGGTVELRVRTEHGRVLFVVTDDGAGITAEAAARAIEPFFTTKPAERGTGLGLAIANEIVKHHQGTLTIGPRGDGAAHGTRASIDVPIAGEETHG